MKKSKWLDCQGNEFFPKQKGTPSLVKIEHKNTATLDSARSEKKSKVPVLQQTRKKQGGGGGFGGGGGSRGCKCTGAIFRQFLALIAKFQNKMTPNQIYSAFHRVK